MSIYAKGEWQVKWAATIGGLLLQLLLAAGCGRLNYDVISTTDASADADAMPAPAPTIECTAPLPALEAVPAVSMVEVGLHTNGLVLVARMLNPPTSLLEARRPDRGSRFGPFSGLTVVAPAGGDPSFVEWGGTTVVFKSFSLHPRELVHCPMAEAAVPCTPLLLFDETGSPILDDVDGPVAAVREGALVLVFNRDRSLYLATPRDARLLVEWDAHQIDFGLPTDDPAMTKDGRLLLTSVREGGADDGLYALLWDESAGTFGPATRVAVEPYSSAEIGVEDGNLFEIFVNGTTRGLEEPHRVSCVFSP